MTTAAVTKIGRLFWLHGLTSVTRATDGGVQQWIIESDYSFADYATKKRFHVYPSNPIAPAFAGDVLKLSCAAFETAGEIQKPAHDKFSTAWIFIQSYYAAYYAANALMRVFGCACSNLAIEQTTALKSSARLHGYPVKDQKVLKTGAYYFEYEQSENRLNAQSLDSISGGVHGQFWHAFSLFAESLVQRITSSKMPTTDKTAVKNEINKLKGLLANSHCPNGNWLSFMRNSVNYKFEHGGWYPYNSSSIDEADLIRLIKKCLQEPDFQRNYAATTDVEKYIATCCLIVAWCKETINEISAANASLTQFAKQAPVPLLQLVGI